MTLQWRTKKLVDPGKTGDSTIQGQHWLGEIGPHCILSMIFQRFSKWSRLQALFVQTDVTSPRPGCFGNALCSSTVFHSLGRHNHIIQHASASSLSLHNHGRCLWGRITCVKAWKGSSTSLTPPRASFSSSSQLPQPADFNYPLYVRLWQSAARLSCERQTSELTWKKNAPKGPEGFKGH